MIWPFRRSQTPVDAPDRHQVTLDLIEQVAALRGQVRSMETEWDDIRVQIQKGYQRMEKANQRAEKRMGLDEEELDEGREQNARMSEQQEGLTGFAKKLAEIRGG